MKLPSVDEFPVGCTVKVVRLPKSHYNRKTLGCIGRVTIVYEEDGYVDVSFDGGGPHSGSVYRPWWLERGRVEWIPE